MKLEITMILIGAGFLVAGFTLVVTVDVLYMLLTIPGACLFIGSGWLRDDTT